MIICVQTGKHFNLQLPQRVNSTLRLRKKKNGNRRVEISISLKVRWQ